MIDLYDDSDMERYGTTDTVGDKHPIGSKVHKSIAAPLKAISQPMMMEYPQAMDDKIEQSYHEGIESTRKKIQKTQVTQATQTDDDTAREINALYEMIIELQEKLAACKYFSNLYPPC